MTKTIVFVHGMFMTPLCWEHWLPWFEAKGYRCLAPAWPGREGPAADGKLSWLTLGAVVDRFARQVAAVREKPILIGHSMGGLITQILVSVTPPQRGSQSIRRRLPASSPAAGPICDGAGA
jgi:pimeloyl-ACP methyl ester carboxylesterase